MGRVLFCIILVLSVNIICAAASIVGMIDYLMGFGSTNFDIVHTLNGLKATKEWHCRLALKMKDHIYVSFLADSMPSLKDLVTTNTEFVDVLTKREQLDILSLFFEKFFDGQEVQGDAVIAILTVLFREQSYENLNLALEKRIINHREVLIFFLRHQELFMDALKADILSYLDITDSIFAGKSVLNILAETNKLVLLKEIGSHFKDEDLKYIRTEHFTKIEGNSILHSAVLSDDPEMIGLIIGDFKGLCGHTNIAGYSPLKLALINGNSYESIKVLLENECIVPDEKLTEDPICEGYAEFIHYEMKKSLEIMAKWSPYQVEEFLVTFEEAYMHIDINELPILKDAYFMGLMNSYQKFIANLVKILENDLNSSPFARTRSHSQSTESSAMKLNMSKYWDMLSSEDFDPQSIAFGQVPLGSIINGPGFSLSNHQIKSLFLKNLAELNNEYIDYSDVILCRFINILITYSEPVVFAHFVDRDIDLNLCIRIMFKYFNDYDKLIPFLNAIGFSASWAFSDGLFPIHLAVIYNRVDLVKFLIVNYEASLRVPTRFSQNNVLHYGLRDTSTREMTNYLLMSVDNLIIYQNVFNVSPLEMVMLFTEKFECINKFVPIFHEITMSGDVNKPSKKVLEIYNEIISTWPSKTNADRVHLDSFNMLFHTITHIKLIRLLLGFISKKIINHLIKEKGSLNTKLIGIHDMILSRDLDDSPAGVETKWSA